jgi:general secretion pathway protein G
MRRGFTQSLKFALGGLHFTIGVIRDVWTRSSDGLLVSPRQDGVPLGAKANSSAGFTLIELLVVIAIIGILASATLASVTTARERARDARRFQELDQIQKALELYFAQNKQYPPYHAYTTTDNCGVNWCDFEGAMTGFMNPLPRDPIGPHADFAYFYDANAGDGYQSYGLMVRLESSSNFAKADSDGGFYVGSDCCYYEVGTQPRYCMEKYDDEGTSEPEVIARWWEPGPSSWPDVCRGGN